MTDAKTAVLAMMANRGIKTYTALGDACGLSAQAARGKMIRRHMTFDDVRLFADGLGFNADLVITNKITGEEI